MLFHVSRTMNNAHNTSSKHFSPIARVCFSRTRIRDYCGNLAVKASPQARAKHVMQSLQQDEERACERMLFISLSTCCFSLRAKRVKVKCAKAARKKLNPKSSAGTRRSVFANHASTWSRCAFARTLIPLSKAQSGTLKRVRDARAKTVSSSPVQRAPDTHAEDSESPVQSPAAKPLPAQPRSRTHGPDPALVDLLTARFARRGFARIAHATGANRNIHVVTCSMAATKRAPAIPGISGKKEFAGRAFEDLVRASFAKQTPAGKAPIRSEATTRTRDASNAVVRKKIAKRSVQGLKECLVCNRITRVKKCECDPDSWV
jgi:hypothetical protein